MSIPHGDVSPAELTRRIKEEAFLLGFDQCRVASIGEAPHGEFFAQWLAAGRAGEMRYLTHFVDRRRAPVLHSPTRDGAAPFRSIIVLGATYSTPAQGASPAVDAEVAHLEEPAHGRIAAYAWGEDYHQPLRRRIYALDGRLREWSGRTELGRGLVDTGPVLERDWAARAGLGFLGKNCCVIDPVAGSWFLLGTLLVPELLVCDDPPQATAVEPAPEQVLAGLPATDDFGAWSIPLHARGETATGTCGHCARCIDACPTRAFVGPFHLDPLRCISYWTIETQAPIPRQLRPLFGNRIFGCDLCQSVCPWNQRLPDERRVDSLFAPIAGHIAPPLLEGFADATPYWLEDAAFVQRFSASPILRATRAGMLRNVCVALGNCAAPGCIPALTKALNDADAAPRGHAAWALGRIAVAHIGTTDEVRVLLALRMAIEENAWVIDEIVSALNGF